MHVLGIGGWRLGWLWTGIPLVAGASVAAARLAIASEARWIWTAAAAVCGVAAVGALTQSAPLSKGVLSDRMDGLSLPFFEELSRRSGGHSWCRPECPRVERVFLPPDVANRELPILTVLLALHEEGLVHEDDIGEFAGRRGFVARHEDVTIAVELVARPSERDAVLVRLSSHRR